MSISSLCLCPSRTGECLRTGALGIADGGASSERALRYEWISNAAALEGMV